MATRIAVAIIICLLWPGILAAQEQRSWVLRVEAGGSRLPPLSPDGASSAGVVLAAHIGRYVGENALLDVGVSQGIGDDNLTGLEFTAELHLHPRQRMDTFVGGGTGLMAMTNMSSLLAPYFLTGGVEVGVAGRHRIRLAGRWGRHVNFGESGNWPGPHMYTVGWVLDL